MKTKQLLFFAFLISACIILLSFRSKPVQAKPEVRNLHHIDYMMKHKVPIDTALKIEKSVRVWSDHFGIDENLVLAVIKTESTFRKNAIGTKNDSGLMQVVPKWHPEKIATAKDVIGDANLLNIQTNIFIGTWVLSDCLYKHGNETKALLCYNGSLGKRTDYAKKVLKFKRKIEETV